MRNQLFIIFMFITISVTNAQQSAFKYLLDTTDKPMTKGVREYYQYKYKAEEYIIKGEYKEAMQMYCKAFSCKAPFKTDYYKAYNCFMQLPKDSLNVTTMLVAGKQIAMIEINDSIRLNYWLQQDSTLKNTTYWKYLPAILAKTRTYKVYPELRYEIDSVILVSDQKVREDCYSIPINDSCNKKYRETDSLNMERYLALVKKYGEVSEYNAYSITSLVPLFRHRCYVNDGRWIPILYKMVREGSVENWMFAEIVDYYQLYYHINIDSTAPETVFGTEKACGYCNSYIIPELTGKEAKTIKKYRDLVCMEEYDKLEMKRKWTYEKTKKEPDFMKFLYPINYQYLYEPNTEQECLKEREKYLQGLNKKGIKYKIINF